MNEADKLMKDIYIKETIGYDLFNKVPDCDKDEIIEFCKIVWNYKKMDNILNKEGFCVKQLPLTSQVI